MPANTDISKLLALPDPLQTYRWVATESFAGLPNQYIERVDIPFNNVEIREGVYHASTFAYFPGFHNVSSFSVSFYEDSKGTALDWIYQWKNKIKDFSTGRYNLPIEYKRELEVHLLDPLGDTVITAKLQGIFPADTGNLSLDYSDANRIIIEQTFSCDNCHLDFNKSGSATFI